MQADYQPTLAHDDGENRCELPVSSVPSLSFPFSTSETTCRVSYEVKEQQQRTLAIEMSSGGFNEAGFSVEDDDIGEMEANSDRFGRLEERFSSIGETSQESVNSGEYLTRLEFDLACCSEKLPNLNVLMMHVATMESEFETSKKDRSLADFAQGAVEFDLLSGILDSEVREMDNFMILIRNKIDNIRKDIYSRRLSEEISTEIQDKLLDCQKSLGQSQDHISEIRKQSATFQTTLSRFYDENGNVEKGATISNDSPLSNANSTKIKMQTAEQQRDILRMLEKTMGREMDLENKLAESKRIEEDLNQRLQSSQQDLYTMEKEMEGVWKRCFEAYNSSEVFRGVSKELLGQVKILKFNLNSLNQREAELRSKLEESTDRLKQKESDLIRDKSEASEKVNLLEKKSREFDIRLQKTVASSEASQEKQVLLNSIITDMENLIRDLKLKVSKEESRAEMAEERFLVLSKTHVQLNEDISFLRGRLNCSEASLQEAEEYKMATSKAVDFQTKIIADLVTRLAVERERLHKQISTLAMENKLLVVKLQHTSNQPSLIKEKGKKGSKPYITDSEEEGIRKTESLSKTDDEAVDFTAKSETAKRIDAGVLNLKYAFLALLILMLSVGFYFFVQQDEQYYSRVC